MKAKARLAEPGEFMKSFLRGASSYLMRGGGGAAGHHGKVLALSAQVARAKRRHRKYTDSDCDDQNVTPCHGIITSALTTTSARDGKIAGTSG
jgi:hypothetical protein